MHILWFRRDLRLSDNEIVALSCVHDAEVLPCFIIDPWFYEQAEVGKARVKFLFESLENLDSNLRALCSQLYLFEGNSINVIQELTGQLLKLGKHPKLFFNHDVQGQYAYLYYATPKINGLIVSDLRKKVKQRLIESESREYQQASKAKITVDKYSQAQVKQYQEHQHQ